MDKSRRYSPARKSFPSLLFRHNRWISEEIPTSFSFKHGRNIDIRGGFRVSSARAPHRSPTSGSAQADRNTRGPRVHRDVRASSKIREELICRGSTPGCS